MTLVVFDIECLEETVVKELGSFKEGIVLGYTFLPPNDYKPTFQAKWNTKNLHGTNCNNEKVDYLDLPTINHPHCSTDTRKHCTVQRRNIMLMELGFLFFLTKFIICKNFYVL